VVLEDEVTHLPHLVRLGIPASAIPLQVRLFQHAIAGKNVMAALHIFFKPAMKKNVPQIVEREACIRRST
jgi:hypothetical protein